MFSVLTTLLSRFTIMLTITRATHLAVRPAAVAAGGLLSQALVRLYHKTTNADIDVKKLTITHTPAPKHKLPNSELVFGRTFSDHMLEIDWAAEDGWGAPRIKPYENLSLSPAATVLHYAMECFEGMKAYKDKQGRIRMFRPDKNMNRLYNSCHRMALPTFDKAALTECIKELLRTDADWIPNEKGYSLYLRPTMIGTQPSLGVGPSAMAKLFVICSPVGPYYKTGFAPVSLLADEAYVRAWPGGVGNYKCGGNYAPGVMTQVAAAKQGYNQLLWLFGDKHQVTEVGTMNFFMLWKNEAGEKELITAPLDGTILPGVTRDSILSLCRQWGEFKVTEKVLYMSDITKALEEKRVIEMFGAGTACIVAPIKNIGYKGKDLAIPLALGTSGELTKRLNDTILGIQYGEIPSEWSVVVD
eukprot:comp21998_c0_seq1/m.31824 comp21998_c0_seq1/g.31824  ORF comp21998_c0_seq1/g.31824 comp21998_c0_seq1/m.31824 type:complete len:415 (-) comp21998_c0_seq1:425-1669(-)